MQQDYQLLLLARLDLQRKALGWSHRELEEGTGKGSGRGAVQGDQEGEEGEEGLAWGSQEQEEEEEEQQEETGGTPAR